MPQGLRVGNLQNWMILFERKLEVGGKDNDSSCFTADGRRKQFTKNIIWLLL